MMPIVTKEQIEIDRIITPWKEYDVKEKKFRLKEGTPQKIVDLHKEYKEKYWKLFPESFT